MSEAVSRGWHYPRIVAHRGGGTLAPENTLAGMRAAQARGLQGVEFDVMLAADEVPVLMHDEAFGRTVPGRGAVPLTPSANLVRMDAGAWLDPAFAGEPVPLFADIAHWLIAQGIWMNVEIKPAAGFEALTGRVTAEHTARAWAAKPADAVLPAPLLSSFSEAALRTAKLAAPDVARAMLWSQVPRGWQATAESLGCTAIHTNHRHLTAALAAEIKAEGYGLMVYTVNAPERARVLLDWGVDGICTDRIDLFPADFA